ncbi:putative mitochondrion protein [Exidia glandulosa HHB12029]|uniref:Mitochondrial pyruvate carrier n=1 Tax=Exidia glandulosa HHB12029 TaxID=1314781 RepID=A0A165CAT0_EXIGL|nr:putative mitochondrion protein [Exidia glandulosa HHB12029]
MSGAATGAASSRIQSFLNHPAGTSLSSSPRPKTVFFWAPMMKWALVIAGISDLKRPADKLSVTQSAALAATGTRSLSSLLKCSNILAGAIWVRYSFVIIPVNYSLAAVNVFVGGTGMYQLYRIWDFRKNNPAIPTPAKSQPS